MMAMSLDIPRLRTGRRDSERTNALDDPQREPDAVDDLLEERNPGEQRCEIGRTPSADW